MVESQPSKLLVAGSIPVSRSRFEAFCGRERSGSPQPKSRAFCARDLRAYLIAMFEQAAIKVDNEREFSDLKAAIEKAFAADRVAKFLKVLDSRGIRIRDLDAVFAADAIDRATGDKIGTARSLHGSLTVSDQAQVREFYLSKIEEVDPALRAKFHKLYQYY